MFVWLRYSLFLITLFSLFIIGTVSLPYNDSATRNFIASPENCGGQCLLGIRPGITTVGEASRHLRNHAWVSDFQEIASGNGYAQLRWQWSGQQPAVIDANTIGRITFFWSDEDPDEPKIGDAIVETITVYTHLRIYSLQQFLGETSRGNAVLRSNGDLGYSAIYNLNGKSSIILTADMPCPANLQTYWQAHTRLSFSIGQGTSEFIGLNEMLGLC